MGMQMGDACLACGNCQVNPLKHVGQFLVAKPFQIVPKAGQRLRAILQGGPQTFRLGRAVGNIVHGRAHLTKDRLEIRLINPAHGKDLDRNPCPFMGEYLVDDECFRKAGIALDDIADMHRGNSFPV